MIGIIIILAIFVAMIFYTFKKEIELIYVHDVYVPFLPSVLPLKEIYEDALELPPMLCIGETCLEESEIKNLLITKSKNESIIPPTTQQPTTTPLESPITQQPTTSTTAVPTTFFPITTLPPTTTPFTEITTTLPPTTTPFTKENIKNLLNTSISTFDILTNTKSDYATNYVSTLYST